VEIGRDVRQREAIILLISSVCAPTKHRSVSSK
jgi:hypothetical protein